MPPLVIWVTFISPSLFFPSYLNLIYVFLQERYKVTVLYILGNYLREKLHQPISFYGQEVILTLTLFIGEIESPIK